MEYKLVNATSKNIKLLKEYKLKTILDYATDLTEEELNKIKNYIDSNLDMNTYKLIINEDNIIGCVCLKEYQDGYMLDEIYLENEYRNLGIGTKIIKDIIKFKKTYLWVYKENKIAFNLYTKLGFKIIDKTDTRYFMLFSLT